MRCTNFMCPSSSQQQRNSTTVWLGRPFPKEGGARLQAQPKHLLADMMLCGPQDNMMQVGGSRSGKTFTL